MSTNANFCHFLLTLSFLPLYQQKNKKTKYPKSHLKTQLNKTNMKTKNVDQFLIANNLILLALSLHFLVLHTNNDEWKEINPILESIHFLFIGLGIWYYYLAFKDNFPKAKNETSIFMQSPTYFITSKRVKSWKSTAP